MVRGTFANIRLKNQLAPGTEGGWTTYSGRTAGGEQMSIYDASVKYREAGVPLIVIGRKRVRFRIFARLGGQRTETTRRTSGNCGEYERIHRSNLVGMGILPLEFKPGENRRDFGSDW